MRTTDLTGKRFGKLTVIEKTSERYKGSYVWLCRCDCGGEIAVDTKKLTRGTILNCGCENKRTHVDNTCIEDLKKRDLHPNNTSGFRGVSKQANGKWFVKIKIQTKQYSVGLFEDFDEAVQARLIAEEALHKGFVETYKRWTELAEANPNWAKRHPFFFRVTKLKGAFHIYTTLDEKTVIIPKTKKPRKSKQSQ